MIRLLTGDCREVLKTLADESIHCVVTSPPYYGLRDYGVAGQLGLEPTPAEYIASLVAVFAEVKRVLHPTGVVFLNLGDSYASTPSGAIASSGLQGSQSGQQAFRLATAHKTIPAGLKPKDLMMIPARVAIALQDDGWYLRSEIVWAKKAPMPESVTDRCTRSHEMVYMLAKNSRYYCDMVAVQEELAESTQERDKYTRISANKYAAVSAGNMTEDGVSRTTAGLISHDQQRSGNGRNLRDVWLLGPEPFSAVKSARRVHVPLDELDGDTIRITSPDCPVHGHLEIVGGEHAVGSLSHNGHNGGRRAPKRRASPAPSSSNSECGHQAQSSDLPLLEYAGVAMPRSTQSHKTGLAPETSPSCTPCEQTAFRTGDTSTSRDPGDDGQHNHENKSAGDSGADEKGSRPSAETSCRNADTLDSLLVPPGCTCSFYKEITEESNHFAVFPTELARRCIAMGTSERGCCPKCGAPIERIVKAEGGSIGHSWHDHENDLALGQRAEQSAKGGHGYRKYTDGWRPTCQCTAGDPVPCTVLDPFAGSGTVGLVAARLDRNAILIDLNPEYSEMQRARVTGDAPLFAEVRA